LTAPAERLSDPYGFGGMDDFISVCLSPRGEKLALVTGIDRPKASRTQSLTVAHDCSVEEASNQPANRSKSDGEPKATSQTAQRSSRLATLFHRFEAGLHDASGFAAGLWMIFKEFQPECGGLSR
jgi:hypothetical protein